MDGKELRKGERVQRREEGGGGRKKDRKIVRKRGRFKEERGGGRGDNIGGEGVTGEYWISAQVALKVPSVY